MVLSMDRWVGKVAIVTGASSGIGAAIAEKLVEEGIKVVGLARRSEQIEEISKTLADKKGKLYAVKTDLTKEEDILNAFKWTSNNVGSVHILINNAAIRVRENLHDGRTATWKDNLSVNVIALCIATREAIKIMRENNIDGHIVHINSVNGHKVINFENADIYPASKHAVTALAETLRLELNSLKSKIKVTSVSPGCVDTPIFDEETRKSKAFQQTFTGRMLKSHDIADAVAYVLATPPHVQVQELTIKPVNEQF